MHLYFKQKQNNAFNEKSTIHFLLYWRELPIQAQRLGRGTTGAGQAEVHTQKLKNETEIAHKRNY